MLSIIHPDQTYCVPNRFISDNITLTRDILELSSSSPTQTGHVSIDQEKPFDQLEHQYLWQTLAAFGFNSVFTAIVQALYSDIVCVIKTNSGLSARTDIQRGVR